MEPLVLAAVVIGVLLVMGAAGSFVASRRRSSQAGDATNPDPMLAAGIVFAGAGVALIASVGPGMIGLMVFGLILMGAGLVRTRRQS